jgi:dihydroflavonol-4-reductase
MIKIPRFVLKTGAHFSSLTGMLTHKPRQLNPSSAYMLCCYNYYTGEKSERELQLQYQSISKAIAQAYDWFHKNK